MCEEKQIENYGYAFLADQADLNQCTRKRGPKPLNKPTGVANLQSARKILISCTCETKLGCVFSFLEKLWKKEEKIGARNPAFPLSIPHHPSCILTSLHLRRCPLLPHLEAGSWSLSTWKKQRAKNETTAHFYQAYK